MPGQSHCTDPDRDHVLPGWNDFKAAVSQAGGLNNISCGCGRTTGQIIIPVPGTGQIICAVKSPYLEGITWTRC